jgi:cytochrome P450
VLIVFLRMQDCVEGQKELRGFMQTQVAERKAELSGRGVDGPRDLGEDAFSLLVKANEDEGGKFKLDDEELVRCFCTPSPLISSTH